MKIEEDDDNEEKPQSSQLHQRQAEENRDGDYLEPDSHDKMSHSSETDDNMSEPETDDSCDWRETREPSNPVQNNEAPVSNMESSNEKHSAISSECTASFGNKSRQFVEKVTTLRTL